MATRACARNKRSTERLGGTPAVLYFLIAGGRWQLQGAQTMAAVEVHARDLLLQVAMQ